jgi:ABC-2 type transport system ATP-binding protein
MLKIDRLNKSFGKKKALDDASFEIEKGKITGFLGPNGAGKTTTINILLGLIRKDGGRIELDGREIQETRGLRFLLRIGSILELPSFYPHLTARENLRLLSLVDHSEINQGKIENLLNMVDLQGEKDDRLKTFSLGMKQKLAVAHALLNEPELLILDEPFNGLDPNSTDHLSKILKDYTKNNGTIFISSHILSEVEDLCDRIVLINKGKIILKEDLKSLTFQNTLKEIYLRLTTNESR